MSTEHARRLRRNMTAAERKLWSMVRDKQIAGLRFRRKEPIGPYYADFYCAKARLVVEFESTIHTPDAQREHERARWFESQKIRILRISDLEFARNPQAVVDAIRRAVTPPGFAEAETAYRAASLPSRG